MNGILPVAICLLFLVSATIAEDAGNDANLGVCNSPSGGGAGVDISGPPSDNNLNVDMGGLSADNGMYASESLANNNANIELSDSLSSSSADVEICDSLSGCFVIANSAEKNDIEADRLVESIVADPQMDLQAEGIDARALQIASHTAGSETNTSSNVAGMVHINWLSKDTATENLTCVLSIEKFLQIWGNSTSGVANVGPSHV